MESKEGREGIFRKGYWHSLVRLKYLARNGHVRFAVYVTNSEGYQNVRNTTRSGLGRLYEMNPDCEACCKFEKSCFPTNLSRRDSILMAVDCF